MINTLTSFKESLKDSAPPLSLNNELRALWYAGNDQWRSAHDIVEELHNPDASWVHAHLHRIEGDEWNAKYWYRRAGKEFPSCPIEQEWEDLVRSFL